MIPFGPYRPDLPDLSNTGINVAVNVIAQPVGEKGEVSYRPLLSPVPVSNALDAPCRGAYAGRNRFEVIPIAGTRSKLFRLDGQEWRDASGATYHLDRQEAWEFAQFGPQIIATNIGDEPQRIWFGSNEFEPLIDPASPIRPRAKHIAVVRDFVVLGYTRERADTFEQRVRWSAIDNPTYFADGDRTRQSDYQDIPGEGGAVMRVVGGENGVIFQQRAINLMSYIGPPFVFKIDEVESSRGTAAPGSVVKLGGTVFFLAADGFFAFDAGTGQTAPIGREQIDRTVLGELHPKHLHRISSAVDHEQQIIMWSYASKDSLDGTPDRLLLLNWAAKLWTHGELRAEWLTQTIEPGYTLEQLDAISPTLDGLDPPLDSPEWTGGAGFLGVFDDQHRLCSFSGDPLPARIESQEAELTSMARTFVRSIRPLVDADPAAEISVQIGSRDYLNRPYGWSGPVPLNRFGRCDLRSNARFHRLRMNINGRYSHALGFDVDAAPEGSR